MIKGMIAPHDQIQSSLFWSTAQIKGNIFVMLTPLKPPKTQNTSNRSEQNKKSTIKIISKIILKNLNKNVAVNHMCC